MAQKIILLPAGAFFVKRLEIAIGLADSDLCGVGFSSISAEAPVPPERLRCGILKAQDGVATAFGALEISAFGAFKAEDLMSARLAMPSFCALLSSGLRDGKYFLIYENGLCAVKLESGAAAEFAALENVEDFAKAKVELADFIGADFSDAKTIKLLSAQIDGKNVEFKAEEIEESGKAKQLSWTIALAKIATCDVRGAEFLSAVARERKKRLLSAAAMAALPAVFALLLIFQLVVFYKSAKIAACQERLASLEPAARAIETRSEKIASFSAMVKSKKLPLELLAQINAVRDDAVAITSFSVYSPNSLDMAGTSDSLAKINDFVAKLKTLPFVSNLKIKSDSSKSQSKFTINCTLKR